jgi:predicted enzyme related to lactoylglutathione lyase
MVRVGSIVINVPDVPSAAEFWAKALDYAPRDGADEGWAMVLAQGGAAPNLSFDRGDRTHLDLYLNPGETQAGEIERLIGLGATRVQDWPYPDGADFVVLADPVGNLFCVIDSAAED